MLINSNFSFGAGPMVRREKSLVRKYGVSDIANRIYEKLYRVRFVGSRKAFEELEWGELMI